MINTDDLQRAKDAALAELTSVVADDLNAVHAKVIAGLLRATRESIKGLAHGRRVVSLKLLAELADDLPILWAATVEGTYQAMAGGAQNGPAKRRNATRGGKGTRGKVTARRKRKGNNGGGRKKAQLTDGLLSSNDAAVYLGVSSATMGYWRKNNRGPKVSKRKVGNARIFVYSKDDLYAWQLQQAAGKKPAPKKAAPKKAAPKKAAPKKPTLRKRTLNAREAAEYLGLTTKQLEYLRHRTDRGPKFRVKGEKHGTRISYRVADLDAWKESQGAAG